MFEKSRIKVLEDKIAELNAVMICMNNKINIQEIRIEYIEEQIVKLKDKIRSMNDMDKILRGE